MMRNFQFLQPNSIDEAVSLLAGQPDGSRPIAGGSDLLSEMKDGLVNPERLVSLAGLDELKSISQTSNGTMLGAMVTIAEIAENEVIRAGYTALAQAAAGLATPQIRNVGTLGGNLNQRPRCWYYRHPLTVCLKKGGDRCFALEGNSKYLCVTGGDRCYIVHPSDTAVALAAFDAAIEIAGPTGLRVVPIEEFFIGPSQDLTRENVLAPGEIVTRVYLPPVDGNGWAAPPQSLYLKARERESGDFALVSVAAVLRLDAGTVKRASVVLGGVAPVPYRARLVEDYLTDMTTADVDPVAAGGLAVPNARPMADNRYKISLASSLVKRAIAQLLTP